MNSIPEITPYDASSVTRNSKCKCTKRCTEFYRVNGFDVYCKGGLEQLATNIFKITSGSDEHLRSYGYGWSTSQEKYLINYIEQNGVHYGAYRKLSAVLGKKRHAIYQKVRELERRGRLTRK